ncbi:MAG: PilZ domain-containing protein [Thermoguttaceae bacterium]
MIEQRRYQRVPYFRPLQVSVLPNGPIFPANSFDISRGGVGLMAAVSLQRGQSVAVLFKLQDQQRQPVDVRVMGKVAYTRADENGNYVGIEFLEPVSESSQPLLAHVLDNL